MRIFFFIWDQKLNDSMRMIWPFFNIIYIYKKTNYFLVVVEMFF